jgi:hypothetical protein
MNLFRLQRRFVSIEILIVLALNAVVVVFSYMLWGLFGN